MRQQTHWSWPWACALTLQVPYLVLQTTLASVIMYWM